MLELIHYGHVTRLINVDLNKIKYKHKYIFGLFYLLYLINFINENQKNLFESSITEQNEFLNVSNALTGEL